MKRHGKKYVAAKKQVPEKHCTLDEAIPLLKKIRYAGFEETMEIALLLGVDPKHADQMVRGTVVLPHGTGATKKVLVIATGEKLKEAEAAGADHVHGPDIVPKIQGGWLEFDTAVATPDLMGQVGRLGKVLGPRGLMPNPKVGTVTFDVARAIREVKAGKVEFKVDKAGNIHVPVGKRSFAASHLAANTTAIIEALVKAKPAAAKGQYLRSITVSTTMGPGVHIDVQRIASQYKL